MFYNLLNFPLQEPASRIQDLSYILGEYQPDLLMVCELNNIDGANAVLEAIQQTYNPNMTMATFFNNTSDDTIGDQNDLQNLIYYDPEKFILHSQDIITTLYRDFNRYTLKLNTTNQTTDPVFLDVFVCHLKASSGVENETLRKEMVDDLIAYLNNPANGFNQSSYVMLAGDFNVYTSSEPAFQELISSTNTITFSDPANRIGAWHNNVSYVDVFTQSTRTTTALGGSSGGFDDRFDFILTSDNMLSDAILSYVPNSYKVFGNNNNPDCYNSAINSFDCSGTEFDFTLRNALHDFSDHLPVTLQIQTNQTLSNEFFTIKEPIITFTKGNLLSTTLFLSVNNNLNKTRLLNIYNILGQKVKSIKINNRSLIEEDISLLANGLYFIKMENSTAKPLKFIKSN